MRVTLQAVHGGLRRRRGGVGAGDAVDARGVRVGQPGGARGDPVVALGHGRALRGLRLLCRGRHDLIMRNKPRWAISVCDLICCIGFPPTPLLRPLQPSRSNTK